MSKKNHLGINLLCLKLNPHGNKFLINTFVEFLYDPINDFIADSTEMGGAVVIVNATDADSGSNAEIHYSLLPPMRGFTIDELTGAIQVNRSAVVLASPWTPVLDLTVVASDAGNPPLSSTAAVRIHINNAGRGNIFGQDEFR